MQKKVQTFFHQAELFIIGLLLVIVIVFLLKKLVLFALIFMLATAIQYYTHKNRINLNFGHVFFLSILVARELGSLYAIILLVFAGFIPKAKTGDVDVPDLVGLPLEIITVFIVSFLNNVNLYLVGIPIVILYYFILFSVAKLLGDSLPEMATEIGLPFLMNIIYFTTISGPMATILALVVAS